MNPINPLCCPMMLTDSQLATIDDMCTAKPPWLYSGEWSPMAETDPDGWEAMMAQDARDNYDYDYGNGPADDDWNDYSDETYDTRPWRE